MLCFPEPERGATFEAWDVGASQSWVWTQGPVCPCSVHKGPNHAGLLGSGNKTTRGKHLLPGLTHRICIPLVVAIFILSSPSLFIWSGARTHLAILVTGLRVEVLKFLFCLSVCLFIHSYEFILHLLCQELC